MHHSVNIPLSDIRIAMGKLDPDIVYVTCCDTGGRTSAAAFLMTQRNFDVYYLENGLDAYTQLLVNDQVYGNGVEKVKLEIGQNESETDNKKIVEEQARTEAENKKLATEKDKRESENAKLAEENNAIKKEKAEMKKQKAKIEVD